MMHRELTLYSNALYNHNYLHFKHIDSLSTTSSTLMHTEKKEAEYREHLTFEETHRDAGGDQVD